MSPFCKMDFFVFSLFCKLLGGRRSCTIGAIDEEKTWQDQNLPASPLTTLQEMGMLSSVTPLSAVPQIKRGLNSELQLSLSLTLWTQVFKCPTSKWSDSLWQPRKDILAHPRLRLMKLSQNPIYRLGRADLIWFNLESGLSGQIIPFTEIGLIKLNGRMI